MYKEGELQPGELKSIFYELMMTDIIRAWRSKESLKEFKEYMLERYGIPTGKSNEYFKKGKENVEENK